MLRSHRLGTNLTLVKAADNAPSLRPGDHNEAVTIMQDVLVDLGFALPRSTGEGTTAPDGVYGPETTEVVKQFQRRQGLQVDGIAGRQTLHRLDELVLQTPHLDTSEPLVKQARLTVEMQNSRSAPFFIT